MKGRDAYRPLDLPDISFSGFAEWARQWMAIGRTEPYIIASGKHQLYVTFCTNDAQAGIFVVDVDEGTPDDPKWIVQSQTKEEWEEMPTCAKPRDSKQRDQFRAKILRALASIGPDGGTITVS